MIFFLTFNAFLCAGFSRQIIQILKDHNIQYSSFDILSDEEVRQGLKIYSNWPTFPQVYVNGEIIGGLDIIKVQDTRSSVFCFLRYFSMFTNTDFFTAWCCALSYQFVFQDAVCVLG